MPVHKVGYRRWRGQKTPYWSRWWIITETGFRIAFKSSWVRRILLVCWLPVLYWGLAIFLIEQTLQRTALDERAAVATGDNVVNRIDDQIDRRIIGEFTERIKDELEMLPQMDSLFASLESEDKQQVRHTIWSWLLMTFFRYPQGMAMLFLLGIIVPGLISQEVRSRAFLLYFSRPLGRIQYIVGKFFVPALFLILITTLPALCLYVFGVILSPDLSVLYGTWEIPFRILAASASIIIPTCSLALMLSSVTQESRFATFAWFAIWALGHAAWFAIVLTQAWRLHREPFHRDVMNDPIVRDWSSVSLYNNLSAVQSWIFGFEPFQAIWPSFTVLAGISLLSLALLYRGVSAPMNV